MPTLEEVKNKILTYLLQAGEANATQLEEKAQCANKTFLKARQQLENAGFITKEYRRKPNGGLYAIYRLTPKGEEEAKSVNMDAKIEEEIERLPPKEKERILLELRYYKMMAKIQEFRFNDLPELAVTKKLESLGFKAAEFKLFNVCAGEIYDDYTPDDILLFQVPIEKAVKNLKKYRSKEVYFKVGKASYPAKLVAYIKSKNLMFFGMYKEFLELTTQLEKIRVDLTKLEFGLSEEDIKKVNPHVLERLSDEEERWRYVASKKPNAFEMFMNHYLKRGFNEKMAKRLTEMELRFFEALERDFQADEI